MTLASSGDKSHRTIRKKPLSFRAVRKPSIATSTCSKLPILYLHDLMRYHGLCHHVDGRDVTCIANLRSRTVLRMASTACMCALARGVLAKTRTSTAAMEMEVREWSSPDPLFTRLMCGDGYDYG